ncbi:MAG: 50S ribosomal protein L22 [Candidatus Kerfeldbacteria bacterium]|nr:50S ribosomal protein L22 [Candidatus Kerfeldbacteria bacterium]
MNVTAKLSFLRQSPRKVKLVIDMVRGLGLGQALEQLSVLPQMAAQPVRKLLQSASANAFNNYKLKVADLWVKTIEVGQGPVLKRWTPRAMGRATPIRKPTAHLRVVLSDEARTKSSARQAK